MRPLTDSPPSARETKGPATEPVPVTAVPPPVQIIPPVVGGSDREPAAVPVDRFATASEPSQRSAVRFDPSSGTILTLTLTLAVVLVSVVAVASFTVSFAGLLSVASWASIPAFIRPLVPVVIDATQLVYTLTAVIQKARGQRTWSSWLAITVFTAVSVAANAAHVLAPRFTPGAEWNGWTAQDLAGAAICALMPVALFFATHTVVGIITRGEARIEVPERTVPPAEAEPSEPERDMAEPLEPIRPGVPKTADRNVVLLRTAVDEAEVLALHARGLSYARIAARVGTNTTRVGRIVRASVETRPLDARTPVR